MNFHRRSVSALAAVLAGLLGLSACNSSPSTRRVAEDIVQSVDGLTNAERECMLDRLDGYSSDDLDVINEQNANVNFSVENPDVSEEWQAFVDDLQSCRGVTSVPGSEPTGSSEPATSSEAASSEPASSSEPAGSTEPGASTEPTASTEG